jgi:glycosyltransferase involved in cell wall biosynthesis
MKIIVATPIYPPEIGGPATYTKELCDRIHNKYEIIVVAYTDSRNAFPGTRLVPVSKNISLPFRLIAYTKTIWGASKNADLIYVQNAMAAGLPVAIVSIFRKIPFIVKFVGDEAWERASQYRLTEKRLDEFLEKPEGGMKIRAMMWIQKFVLKKASIVTTPSVYLSEAIKKAYGVNENKLKVNYNAAEEPESFPFEGKRNEFQVVTTARLVVWKGIDGIIKAIALLKKSVPNIKLMVAGDGPELENLKKLAEKLGVKENVTFLGRISRAETWQLRNKSTVYVLNSFYEGLPHTVLTSFASGIPTIATNIPGTDEAVYDEKTGLLVKPQDPEGLAKAIDKLLKNPDLREKLVKNGYKLLKEKFSWEAHIEELERIFQSVLAKPIN